MCWNYREVLFHCLSGVDGSHCWNRCPCELKKKNKKKEQTGLTTSSTSSLGYNLLASTWVQSFPSISIQRFPSLSIFHHCYYFPFPYPPSLLQVTLTSSDLLNSSRLCLNNSQTHDYLILILLGFLHLSNILWVLLANDMPVYPCDPRFYFSTHESLWTDRY